MTRTVLITGAAKRIGAALARDLHANGMNVIIHYYRSENDARSLADALNAARRESAFLLRADLLETDGFDALMATAALFTGKIDVLINNASMFYPTPVGEITPQQWMELVGTNLKAPCFLSQSCVTYLRENDGCIINITDIYGMQPLKDHPVYSTAKAGLIMLTRALAKELGPHIRVNAVSPGAILWPESLADSAKQAILSKIPLERQGAPEDIAGAVRYLIDSEYVTGQVINVDGGRSLF